MTGEACCGTCRWWRRLDPSDPAELGGTCHRHAAAPVVMEEDYGRQFVTIWPPTFIEEFCGEHAARDGGQAPGSGA